MKRMPLPNFIPRTGATFETTARFLQESRVVRSSDRRLPSVGVPLTEVNHRRAASRKNETIELATAKKELHTVIIGDSGCGKTRRVILPLIRLMAKTGRSMVISDPKGELYRKTAGAVKNNGYSTQVINFRNMSRGIRWNPFTYIEKLYHSGSVEARDQAILNLKDIASLAKANISSEKDRFWEMTAVGLFLGLAQIILEGGKPGDLSFVAINTLAREIFANKANYKSLVMRHLPADSPIRGAMEHYFVAERETEKSIIAVFSGMMSYVSDQRGLMELMSDSDLDLGSFGREPTALYIILPDDSDAMYPIATILVKQIYSTLINQADNNQNGTLANGVSFILDEFANFAPIPSVDAMLTAARSRDITFTLVCQDVAQLSKAEKYGSEGMNILLSNCRVWIYMSSKSLDFLNRLVRLCGDYMSPYTGEKTPLVSVMSLQQFPIGKVLLLNDRCKPMIGYLPDYDAYDFGETAAPVDIPPARSSVAKPPLDCKATMSAMIERTTSGLLDEITRQPAVDSELRASIMARTDNERRPILPPPDLSDIRHPGIPPLMPDSDSPSGEAPGVTVRIWSVPKDHERNALVLMTRCGPANLRLSDAIAMLARLPQIIQIRGNLLEDFMTGMRGYGAVVTVLDGSDGGAPDDNKAMGERLKRIIQSLNESIKPDQGEE